MNDLRDLYQELIIDHSKRPRNFGEMAGASQEAEGYNPLCGDKVTIFVKLNDGRIEQIGFQGSGCAISTASASIMTETLKGKSLAEAEALFARFHGLVAGKENPEEALVDLGKMAVFSGVRDYPTRVKCATLAWHTLKAALKGEEKTVSTE